MNIDRQNCKKNHFFSVKMLRVPMKKCTFAIIFGVKANKCTKSAGAIDVVVFLSGIRQHDSEGTGIKRFVLKQLNY